MGQGRKPIQHRQYKVGRWDTVDTDVITEAPVALTVNGQVWLTFMCTPVELEALAVGFLFNEGVINSMAEVAAVRVCPTGDNVDVWLRRAVEKPDHWTRTSGCTGGATSASFTSSSPTIMDGVELSPRMIGELIEALLHAQSLYRETGGVHTSALSDGCQLCVVAEDIGRHNTLDKLAGRCLIDQVVSCESVLLTTGRVSSEMIQKAARIGSPIVISRTSPSSLSIDLADRWGITLIGYARRDRFNVYTHPERIISEATAIETEEVTYA